MYPIMVVSIFFSIIGIVLYYALQRKTSLHLLLRRVVAGLALGMSVCNYMCSVVLSGSTGHALRSANVVTVLVSISNPFTMT